MNVQLSDELQRFVRAQVLSGRYDREEDVIRDVRDWLRARERQSNPQTNAPEERVQTVDEMIDVITADVPEDEWARLPTDGAEQHDHYLYGTPKRPS